MKKILCFLFLALCCITRCRAQQPTEMASTMRTVAATLQEHPFKQTGIATCSSISPGLSWNNTDLQYEDGDLTIKGTDQLGHAYSITKGMGIAGCSLWAASLDGIGSPELEILTPGEDSSGGYDSTLTIIFVDQEGRPFPWQATGKFTAAGDAGIEQIIADPTDHRADVIVHTKEGIGGQDASHSFELYRVTQLAVTKFGGKLFGATWPMMWNATPSLIRHRLAASLTMNLNASGTRTQLVGSAAQHITGHSLLTLADGSTILPPAIIVQDAADGDRTINLDPVPEDITKLLQDKVHVRAVGTSCDEEECRPMVLIATP